MKICNKPLTRLPVSGDPFDVAISFVGGNTYLSFKVNKQWSHFKFFRDTRKEREPYISTLGSYSNGNYIKVNENGTLTLYGDAAINPSAHTHADADNGGQLDWDDIWSDAEHNHQSSGEGGQLDHGLAVTGLTDDDHTQYPTPTDQYFFAGF